MQDIFYINTVEQATTLLKPLRAELLKRLDQPRTCPELAKWFGLSTQKVNYHIRVLEKAGLVEKVAERPIRGVKEGVYQATARVYALAPQLVGELGSRRQAADQTSLRALLALAEEMHAEVGRLGRRSEVGEEAPSLSVSAQIHLPETSRRAEFMRDVQAAIQALAKKYGVPGDEQVAPSAGETFHLIVACYPQEERTSE